MKRILMLLPLIICACAQEKYPKEITLILKENKNSTELIKVIDHFKNDSLKKEAVFFLIQHMKGKGSVVYAEKNKKGKKISYDWSKHYSLQEARKAKENQGITIEIDTVTLDIENVKANYLIKNIEDAFSSWTNERKKNISFNNFLNYTLPYRDRYEKLSNDWRNTVLKNKFIKKDKNKSNLEIVKQLNDSLKSKFGFNFNYTLSIKHPSFKRLDTLKNGSCPYMTSLAIHYMRAYGIPVARDYVSHWTNVHHFSNHEWNAMLDNDGKWKPFMGCETNPEDYKPSFHAAKVYRETYSNNTIALHKVIKNREEIPNEFKKQNIIDVTHFYYDTGNIHIQIPKEHQKEKALYLAVYNQKKWSPVYWGIVKKDSVVFKNMSKGVVYLPLKVTEKGKFIPISTPFLFNNKGQVIPIIKAQEKETIQIYSFGLGDLGSKDYINTLKKDQEYILRYWNKNNWQIITSKIAKKDSDTLVFNNVPKNTLLSLGRKDEFNNSGEQLFIFKNSQQHFY